MSKGNSVFGYGKPGEVVTIASVIQEADITLKAKCLESCGTLRQFISGQCLAQSADLIEIQANDFAVCQGERRKAFGRTACGGL
jgi:hypothetical protein